MINKLKWVASLVALALVVAPAAHGADGNPWHINVYGAGSARLGIVRSAASKVDTNPWHINVYGSGSARLGIVRSAASQVDTNPWHINVYVKNKV
jgi:hypothetical protein